MGDSVADSSGSEPSTKMQRVHSLDAYRGVLMLLGIVIHSAFKFPVDEGDYVTDAVNHLSLWAVHIFRMPAFFILSGFFGSLLWRRYGGAGMLMNRFERVVLPLFAVMFLVPILFGYPALVSEMSFKGSDDPFSSAAKALAKEVPLDDFIHLWFLYILIWVTLLVAWFLRWDANREYDWTKWQQWIRTTFESPWRFVFIFGGLNMLLTMPFGATSVPVGTDWIPRVSTIAYYTLFFGLGWVLYTSKARLATTADRAWQTLSLGMACVVVHATVRVLLDHHPSVDGENLRETSLIFLTLAGSWSIGLFAMTHGLMGLFFRYAASESYGWRYLSDASYWVYLFHLVATESLPLVIRTFQLPSLVSHLLLLVLSTVASFVTYDLFIRSTFMGRFLNGRRYPRLGWRLNGPGLVVIVSVGTVYGTNIWDEEQSYLAWADRGGAISQIPFDLSPKNDGRQPVPAQERCTSVGARIFCEDKLSQPDARKRCADLGGRLLVVRSKHEAKTVAAIAPRLNMRDGYWIDINDRSDPGTWVDSDGAHLDFTGWARGQPDNHDGHPENCVAEMSNGGHWHDVPCDIPRASVCEYVEPNNPDTAFAPCEALLQALRNWQLETNETTAENTLAMAITAECGSALNTVVPIEPIDEPPARLAGTWRMDTKRLMADARFQALSDWPKGYAYGLMSGLDARITFGQDRIALHYRAWQEDIRIQTSYDLKTKNADSMTISIGEGNVKKDYTLTLDQQGMKISRGDTIWFLTTKSPLP